MFYEENCPPITIISEEEAVVESVARNGEGSLNANFHGGFSCCCLCWIYMFVSFWI